MSDEDKDSKTEDPTEKKLADAREKGQVASSKEVNSFFILGTAAALVAVAFPMLADTVLVDLRTLMERPHALTDDPDALGRLLRELVVATLLVLLVPLVSLAVAGLAGSLIQNGFVASVEPMMPKLSKISPLAGFKRLFSVKSLVEFLKGLLKMIVVGVVAFFVLMPPFQDMGRFTTLDMAALTDLIHDLIVRLMMAVVVVVALIAGADVLWQRHSFRQSMRMTKQEVKEEYKNTEGDPHIKGRRRQIAMETSRRRMMAAVPTADVVITNPTHYAIALKYDPAVDQAPKVVAKGVDFLALKIREVAQAAKVPVREAPPLARALYDAVDLDQVIPVGYYKAVAEIISVIFRERGGTTPGTAAARG